jgi:hypothetical protein
MGCGATAADGRELLAGGREREEVDGDVLGARGERI